MTYAFHLLIIYMGSDNVKAKNLEKITDGRYYFKDGYLYAKGNKRGICNFYISELKFYTTAERETSFEITIENSDNESCCGKFSIAYLHEPYGWYNMLWDNDFYENFVINSTRTVFENCFIDIINAIIKNGKYSAISKECGWLKEEIGSGKIFETSKELFEYYCPDDCEFSIDNKYAKKKYLKDVFYKYSDTLGNEVLVPLLSYTVLSFLTSLQPFGSKRRPNFIMSLTGGKERERERLALFISNFYCRHLETPKDDYRAFHIMPDDSFSDIREKALIAKDCVLIAFNPNKRMCGQIQKLYGCSVIDEENPVLGLCIIVTDDANDIPFETFNVSLNEEFSMNQINNGFKEYWEDGSLHYRNDVVADAYKRLIKTVEKELNEDRGFVNTFFNNTLPIKNEESLTESAQTAGMYLKFAFELCMTILYGGNSFSDKYKGYEEILIRLAADSFPKKLDPKIKDFADAKNVCNSVEKYFSDNSGKKQIGKIGAELKNITDIKLWYDDKTFYITQKNISDLLLIDKNKNKFSLTVKRALAKKNIIETYIKSDGKPEYSVHIQKPLFDNKKAKNRFIAFNRAECKKNNIFKTIEEYVAIREIKKKISNKKKSTVKRKNV